MPETIDYAVDKGQLVITKTAIETTKLYKEELNNEINFINKRIIVLQNELDSLNAQKAQLLGFVDLTTSRAELSEATK